jgi:hypothetical protein
MKYRAYKRKLSRFLYFRNVEKSERKALLSHFQSKVRSGSNPKSLYREMKRDAKDRYTKNYSKIELYGLCSLSLLLLLIPLMECIVIYLYFILPPESLSPAVLQLLETFLYSEDTWTIYYLYLSYFSANLNALTPLIVAITMIVELFRRRIRLTDCGRNVSIAVFQMIAFLAVSVLAATLMLMIGENVPMNPPLDF